VQVKIRGFTRTVSDHSRGEGQSRAQKKSTRNRNRDRDGGKNLRRFEPEVFDTKQKKKTKKISASKFRSPPEEGLGGKKGPIREIDLGLEDGGMKKAPSVERTAKETTSVGRWANRKDLAAYPEISQLNYSVKRWKKIRRSTERGLRSFRTIMCTWGGLCHKEKGQS